MHMSDNQSKLFLCLIFFELHHTYIHAFVIFALQIPFFLLAHEPLSQLRHKFLTIRTIHVLQQLLHLLPRLVHMQH